MVRITLYSTIQYNTMSCFFFIRAAYHTVHHNTVQFDMLFSSFELFVVQA